MWNAVREGSWCNQIVASDSCRNRGLVCPGSAYSVQGHASKKIIKLIINNYSNVVLISSPQAHLREWSSQCHCEGQVETIPSFQQAV